MWVDAMAGMLDTAPDVHCLRHPLGSPEPDQCRAYVLPNNAGGGIACDRYIYAYCDTEPHQGGHVISAAFPRTLFWFDPKQALKNGHDFVNDVDAVAEYLWTSTKRGIVNMVCLHHNPLPRPLCVPPNRVTIAISTGVLLYSE